MVYNRGQVRTKSVGLKHFRARNFKGVNGRIRFIVNAYVSSLLHRSYIEVGGSLTERAFVIENLSAGKTNCRQSEVTDLEIPACDGDIQLRPLNDDD